MTRKTRGAVCGGLAGLALLALSACGQLPGLTRPGEALTITLDPAAPEGVVLSWSPGAAPEEVTVTGGGPASGVTVTIRLRPSA
jgi:hypothetical protein